MTSRSLIAWSVVLLLSPLPLHAADALPKGALLRLGTLNLHHNGSAINVVFAPDGKSLVSSGNDHLVRLWDAATGKEIRRFEGHTANVDGLAFSPDGKVLLTSGMDATLRLWDVATGKEKQVLNGHQGGVNAAVWSPDGKYLASKGLDRTGRIWDAATGKELHQFPVAVDRGSPITFSPDSKTLAVVGPDLSLILLDTATAKEVQKFAGHKVDMNSLDFSPDGKLFASAGTESVVRIWDVATGKEVRQLKGHDGTVCSVHFSADGKLMATAGYDKTIRIWDAKTGEELRRCPGHSTVVSEVAFSPDSKMLASASWDYTVRLFDVATGKELPQSAGPGPLACAALSADGKLLATGHAGHGIHLWDPATGKPLARATLDFDGPVTSLVMSPDGKFILAANAAGDFAVWETATGKQRFAVKEEKSDRVPFRRQLVLGLSPDGQLAAVVRNMTTGAVDFYDGGGKLLRSVTVGQAPENGGFHYPPHAVAIAPDGRTFVASSAVAGVRMYETASGNEVRQLVHMMEGEGRPGGVAFSRDGRSVAAGGVDGSVTVWETATGGERRKLPADKAAVGAMAFSGAGRLLAAPDATGVVHVWSLATGKDLQSFKGHDGPVTTLAFGGSGRLLSVGNDGTAILWDTSTVKADAKGPEKIDAAASWTGLGEDDAGKAFEVIARLESSPEAAVALLRQRLKAATAADAKHIDQLIVQLNDDDFDKREGASRELGGLGSLAEKALRQALKTSPSAESTRRIKELLKKIEEGTVSGEGVRSTGAGSAGRHRHTGRKEAAGGTGEGSRRCHADARGEGVAGTTGSPRGAVASFRFAFALYGASAKRNPGCDSSNPGDHHARPRGRSAIRVVDPGGRYPLHWGRASGTESQGTAHPPHQAGLSVLQRDRPLPRRRTTSHGPPGRLHQLMGCEIGQTTERVDRRR